VKGKEFKTMKEWKTVYLAHAQDLIDATQALLDACEACGASHSQVGGRTHPYQWSIGGVRVSVCHPVGIGDDKLMVYVVHGQVLTRHTDPVEVVQRAQQLASEEAGGDE
jgi:hypothetical protein